MYRYSVDNAITYTSEDFVLFKESPFACWMERLTLENRDHGIPPDVGSEAPHDNVDTQDDLADTLRAEGKNVILIESQVEESLRRSSTLDAMRKGVDFIVNGQLALGALSGSANLLMRTSGYSELGNYLYVPCSTQKKTSVHSALRLCFLADLLHSLQGQLPPQMLIIRGGSDVVPQETEDHIYHYRAVKHRFMAEQQAFRQHKMPDPAESASFGRWAECANEVLKQRALRNEDYSGKDSGLECDYSASSVVADLNTPIPVGKTNPALRRDEEDFALSATVSVPVVAREETQLRDIKPEYVLPAPSLDVPIAYNPQPVIGSDSSYDSGERNRLQPAVVLGADMPSGTLAEQARKLTPDAKVEFSDAVGVGDALENLAFIGSSNQVPTIGQSALSSRPGKGLDPERRAQPNIAAEELPPVAPKPSVRHREPVSERVQVFADANASMVAPPPSLRNPTPREMAVDSVDFGYTARAMTVSDYELSEQPSAVQLKDTASMVDMDDTIPLVETRLSEEASADAVTLEPAATSAIAQTPEKSRLHDDAAAFIKIFSDKDTYLSDDSSVDTFNNKLITSEDDFDA
jgi:hypothetical protein